MTKAVVDIDAVGNISCQHRDELGLRKLGVMEISRASEILFCDITQSFYVALADVMFMKDVPALRGFEGYDEARKYEVMLLDSARLHGMEPSTHVDFVALAEKVRVAFDKGERDPLVP